MDDIIDIRRRGGGYISKKIKIGVIILLLSLCIIFLYMNIKRQRVTLRIIINIIKLILSIIFSMLILSFVIISISVMTNTIPYENDNSYLSV